MARNRRTLRWAHVCFSSFCLCLLLHRPDGIIVLLMLAGEKVRINQSLQLYQQRQPFFKRTRTKKKAPSSRPVLCFFDFNMNSGQSGRFFLFEWCVFLQFSQDGESRGCIDWLGDDQRQGVLHAEERGRGDGQDTAPRVFHWGRLSRDGMKGGRKRGSVVLKSLLSDQGWVVFSHKIVRRGRGETWEDILVNTKVRVEEGFLWLIEEIWGNEEKRKSCRRRLRCRLWLLFFSFSFLFFFKTPLALLVSTIARYY